MESQTTNNETKSDLASGVPAQSNHSSSDNGENCKREKSEKGIYLVHVTTGEKRNAEVTAASKNWKLIVRWQENGMGLSKGGYAIDLKLDRLRMSERGSVLLWKCENLDTATRLWKLMNFGKV